ncbi:MAG: HAMP domain-containing sensor histidine kinase [Anaerostipes sp.]|nr:HAMP domain-containing sensor histidine kinase [Anaerostipes sp.]
MIIGRKTRKKRKTRKTSIQTKLAVITTIIMAAVIVVSVLANFSMLKPFYVYREKKSIVSTYEKINRLYKKKTASDTAIDLITRVHNYRMIIANASGELQYSSEGKQGVMYNSMINSLDSIGKINKQIKENGYAVVTGTDKSQSGTSINLIGYLDNGYMIVITTPMESIQTSALLSGQFTAVVGFILVIMGAIVMFLYSKRFTRPIEEMSHAARRMSELDFDVKVKSYGDDEIGRLGESINDLSTRLEEIISELKTANVQLQNDIEKKVQIDEMRKEFLSHVSHELKTPIALIQGYAEGLKDNILDDPESQEFYCDVIGDEAKKMNKMVQKLLTLNQIEFGNNQVNMEHFDIHELIENMISANKIFFEKTHVTVEFKEKPTYVWADEFMIEEVFGNYFSNARNHVTEGGIIRVRFEKRDTDLRVYVFNSGQHIPEEDIDKLWVKFYKVDKARTREYGGSGIGLSIVAATMNAHGKEYGVANVEGGVEFYFDLDCTKE